jgi:hypothetical protein
MILPCYNGREKKKGAHKELPKTQGHVIQCGWLHRHLGRKTVFREYAHYLVSFALSLEFLNQFHIWVSQNLWILWNYIQNSYLPVIHFRGITRSPFKFQNSTCSPTCYELCPKYFQNCYSSLSIIESVVI